MNKLSLFLFLAFLGIFTANAQTFSFGPKIGANYFILNGENAYDFERKIGFSAGFFVDVSINNWFSLQGEINYSRQGAKQDINSMMNVNVVYPNDPAFQKIQKETHFNLNYITVPVLAKFYPSEGFHLLIGPQVGFLVSAKEKLVDGGTIEMQDYERDIEELFRSTDFGLVIGAGYDFDIGLTLQARYYQGLVKINKMRIVVPGNTKVNSQLRNNGFEVSLGYRF